MKFVLTNECARDTGQIWQREEQRMQPSGQLRVYVFSTELAPRSFFIS